MLNSIKPDELGRELRQGYGPFLKRRRGIIGLCFFSCGVLGAVALYQIGILKKLPEPRGRAFDTGKVNGSGEAYSILATPDAFLGLVSYAGTSALVAMGSENRSQTHPWIPIAMGAKLLADSAIAAKLTIDEATKFRAFSLWSVLTGAATWIAFPLALPETVAAVRQLGSHDRA